MGRIIVVVDDDVDPSDLADVMWAIATRCEPSEAVDIVRDAWSSSLDPSIPPERRLIGATSHSKMIIDACKPFAWLSDFPPISAMTHEDMRIVEQKWRSNLVKG
jgi:4-hydroxy-3-polyprenylbenzoate decarboxylase